MVSKENKRKKENWGEKKGIIACRIGMEMSERVGFKRKKKAKKKNWGEKKE